MLGKGKFSQIAQNSEEPILERSSELCELAEQERQGLPIRWSVRKYKPGIPLGSTKASRSWSQLGE